MFLWRIVCAVIGHGWTWNRAAGCLKTSRWMTCDRCMTEARFPDEKETP